MVKLQVYIKEDCWICAESRRIVSDIAPQFPQLSVELVDVTVPNLPTAVFAVPTYVLDGRIISLGNPYREVLRQEIRNVLGTKKIQGKIGIDHFVYPADKQEDDYQMQAQKLNYLSSIQVFRDLSPTELADMDRQITMFTCDPGKIFYMPEDSGEILFLLKKGHVQIYRLAPNGKKLVVVTLGPGAIFGEMSLVGQGMHNTFAEAVDECLICVMSRADVERLMREKPDVAFRFLETMGNRVTQLEERLENIAFRSIPARLAELLLRLTGENGEDEILGYTHQDFSEMLGTYRETITQTLNEFKAQGLIDIGRKRIVLLDRLNIKRLAGT